MSAENKATINNRLKPDAPKRPQTSDKRVKFNGLFDSEWEVFVVKKDKATGKFVGKTACCAWSPV